MRDTSSAADSAILDKLDRLTRFASEDLARAMDRRAFLRRTGSGAFALLATLATGRLFAAPLAGAAPGQPRRLVPETPVCTPPGPFCNVDGNYLDPNGCNGAHCFHHLYYGQVLTCRLFYQYFPTGCWTNPAQGKPGYWTCCDCECGNPRLTTCGCAQYSLAPTPQPMLLGR